MHPILGVRRRLSVYLLAWLVIGVLLAVGLRGERAWIAAAVFYLPLCAVFAFVTLSTWYLCRAFPMDARSKTWAVASVHLLAAGLASALWMAMAGAWARTLDSLAPGLAASALYGEQAPLLFVVGALLFWLAASFHYLLIA